MQEEADRLAKRFEGVNKAKFGRDFKVPGGGAMIHQHMNAIRPISLDAALAYSRGFGVPLKEISQRLTKEVTDAVPNLGVNVIPISTKERGRAPAGISVPVLANAASMGTGAEMQDDDIVTGALTLSPKWIGETLRPSRPDALRFIHGEGDSMMPTFNSGDVLLVDSGITEVKTQGIFVLESEGRMFVKRVSIRMDGTFEVSSDNPAVKMIGTLNGDHAINVLGRVVWVWNGRKM